MNRSQSTHLDLERVGRVEDEAWQNDPQVERRCLLQLREERRVLRARQAGAVNKDEDLREGADMDKGEKT